MAKIKSPKKKNGGFTIPLAVVAGFTVPLGRLWYDYKGTKNLDITTRQLGQFFTGYDWTTGKFNFELLKFGTMPVLAGFAVHMLASKMGINRLLGSAGIPIIRL